MDFQGGNFSSAHAQHRHVIARVQTQLVRVCISMVVTKMFLAGPWPRGGQQSRRIKDEIVKASPSALLCPFLAVVACLGRSNVIS